MSTCAATSRNCARTAPRRHRLAARPQSVQPPRCAPRSWGVSRRSARRFAPVSTASEPTTHAEPRPCEQLSKHKLGALNMDFIGFTTDMAQQQAENRDALHARLNELRATQAAQQEKFARQRSAAAGSPPRQPTSRSSKRCADVVDEKLHATLHSRLTESFGQVTDQLTKVHAGLGEMNKLSAGVDDLSRIFTNVKSRGGFAEVQLGSCWNRCWRRANSSRTRASKQDTQEVVEFAVKFPDPTAMTFCCPSTPSSRAKPGSAWRPPTNRRPGRHRPAPAGIRVSHPHRGQAYLRRSTSTRPRPHPSQSCFCRPRASTPRCCAATAFRPSCTRTAV